MADPLPKAGPRCTLRKYKGKPRTCVWCGKTLPVRRIRWCSDACPNKYLENHTWTDARSAALKRSKGRCRMCKAPSANLEVNHVEPRVGRGYGPGCHHHQRNLEVLCHAHHVEVTNQQRRDRVKAKGISKRTIRDRIRGG